MENTQIISGKFSLNRTKFLGNGAFGQVFEGEELRTKIKVAIKEININKMKNDCPDYDESLITEEIYLMQQSTIEGPSKHIAKIIDYNITETYLYIVLEFC